MWITRPVIALATLALVVLAAALIGLAPTVSAQTQSSDATLSTLEVSPQDIIGFRGSRTSYEVGVASDVAQATVTATKNHAEATVAYSGADADTSADGHQVDLSAGRNTVMITVTAGDGTTKTYTVRVNRGVDTRYGWKASDDLDGLVASGNIRPIGLWSNGTTFWTANASADKLYAYHAAGARDAGKDFNTLIDAGNDSPRGIWSDGTTIWVADFNDRKIYAYRMSNKARDPDKDFNRLNGAGNTSPNGIWSDGRTMWVADSGDGKLYAYRMSNQARDAGKDFNTLIDAGNDRPTDIWSDGTTMWVADSGAAKLYAYRMSDKSRDSGKDFNTLRPAGNDNVAGIWSDGATMWVVDITDGKVYSYNMPSRDATLSGLTVRPRDIIGFDSGRVSYEVGVASDVARATVTATANHAQARAVFSVDDADPSAAGHQVDLSAGRNTVRITVTAEYGTTKTYTVRVNRGVTDDYGWKASADLDGLIAAGNRDPVGIWSDGTTMWVADWGDDKVYAYRMSNRTRDSGKDFGLGYTNRRPVGIWSDGTTMWVADSADGKLYAYRMSNRTRDSGKDFDLHADNGYAKGIWSDRTTMWVADSTDDKLYAYTLSDGARDSDKDFDLHDASGQDDNGYAQGIWSDGTTMWVADHNDSKLYAYSLSTKARDSAKDFDTLHAAGNVHPQGIWSDDTTVWVGDSAGGKVYSYNFGRLGEASEKSVRVRNNPATGAPTITGTAQVGETLSASTSGITDDDGLKKAMFAYQWLADDAEISGATSASYTLVDADAGKAIRVRVSFADDRGHEETLTSAATGAVAARPNTAATGAPAISGRAQVGEMLTASTSGIADEDGLENASFTYQWVSSDGTTDTAVQDATGASYTLVDADAGKAIRVRVSFTDDSGHEETLTSAATARLLQQNAPCRPPLRT